MLVGIISFELSSSVKMNHVNHQKPFKSLGHHQNVIGSFYDLLHFRKETYGINEEFGISSQILKNTVIASLNYDDHDNQIYYHKKDPGFLDYQLSHNRH
jgi:hypothetical protein